MKSKISDLEKGEGVKCPHCEKAIGIGLTTKLMNESRMSFQISPAPGELLTAYNVGMALANMDKLLVAIGKDMDAKTVVGLEGVSCVDGTVKFDLLLARQGGGVTTQAKDAA